MRNECETLYYFFKLHFQNCFFFIVSSATVMNLKDSLKENSRLYIERSHYALQLKDHLNTVREEAAIQVTKIKDFFECQKLKHTVYIQQLEKQLAESRAIACSEFKKHDHVSILFRNINAKPKWLCDRGDSESEQS